MACFAIMNVSATGAPQMSGASRTSEGNDGRIPDNTYCMKWDSYIHKHAKGGKNTLLSRYYFKATVSVDEMVAAFHANKDNKSTSSPYAGHDSIQHGLYSEQVLLTSPLPRHPDKKARACRGVWTNSVDGYRLVSLQGKDGKTDEALTEKVLKEEARDWMEGDFVTLRKPCHYMGFIVSPRVSLTSFNKERVVGHEGCMHNKADFFSHAGTATTLDGDWDSEIRGGALLLGKFLTLCSSYNNANTPERTFSVLLYQKPDSPANKREYTLRLLLPENPDTETTQAFEEMKRFVEKLRYNTYNPLYTTDFRVMTGRYYRVTVNKCGWLVEDYMEINRK